VRFAEEASPRTRIRFVTEGILLRRLLADPRLSGVEVVILDEFHERHLASDLALALLRRLQLSERPDLGLVAMSATLDAYPVCEFLGDCPLVRSEGRLFEISVQHLAQPDTRPLAEPVASAVRRLCQEGLDGDVLVFLPGAAEIRRAGRAIDRIAERAGLLVLPLHGDLPPAEQARAVQPADRRKVILSTNVAESSVTIEGVTTVIDSGLARVASQSPWSGLPRLAAKMGMYDLLGMPGLLPMGRWQLVQAMLMFLGAPLYVMMFGLAVAMHMIWDAPWETPFHIKEIALGFVVWVALLGYVQFGLRQIRNAQATGATGCAPQRGSEPQAVSGRAPARAGRRRQSLRRVAHPLTAGAWRLSRSGPGPGPGCAPVVAGRSLACRPAGLCPRASAPAASLEDPQRHPGLPHAAAGRAPVSMRTLPLRPLRPARLRQPALPHLPGH